MVPDLPVQVRRTDVQQIIDLRWRVLREGLPRQAASFPGDDEPGTIHFAAFADGRVVGCATFLRRTWENRSAWQLRGMAIDPSLRGAGIGTHLLQVAESDLTACGFSNQLWCNARTPATGFYERLGWRKYGEEFVVETAGPHFKMTKLLGQENPLKATDAKLR
jgi:GNAT superfamily N-acetyltransferase